MQETNIYHLLTEHRIIVFAVCSVILMFATTIIGIKVMNYLDNRLAEKNLKKKE